MKSAKQCFIDHGYSVMKIEGENPRSIRRRVFDPLTGRAWDINDHEELENLASQLLGYQCANVESIDASGKRVEETGKNEHDRRS